MIGRIFSDEFSPHFPRAPHWFEGGDTYIAIEPAKAGGQGVDVVKYDTATGKQREVLISAAQLTPPGASAPLSIADLSWSGDHKRVLVFTNTRRVWRTDSRGDYWLLDRGTGKLRKLGGEAPEASLMYATFSPDATKVAYVLRNDIHVEDVATGAIKRITRDGSDLVVNGGSDWVNEEELDLHDCFRWSPDGRRIAFWQFDLHGVGNFSLQVLPRRGERDRHADSLSEDGSVSRDHERAVSAGWRDELGGTRRRGRQQRWGGEVAADPRRSARALHRTDAMG